MKKCFVLILSIAIVMGLSSCTNKSRTAETHIPVGSYEMKESEEVIKPTVLLEDDNKFTFTYSALSSYIAIGSYEENSDDLILKTSDEKFKYVFRIEDGTLVFRAKESSEIPSFANVPDGAIFE